MAETIAGQIYICGDVNDDGLTNILDETYIISYLYFDGPDPVSLNVADVNNNGIINILDIAYYLSYLYLGGPDLDCP